MRSNHNENDQAIVRWIAKRLLYFSSIIVYKSPYTMLLSEGASVGRLPFPTMHVFQTDVYHLAIQAVQL